MLLYLSSWLLPACSGAQSREELRELEKSYLAAAVAPDLIQYAAIEIPAIENIRKGADTQGNWLELRTRHGQALKNGGVRAEVSVDYPFTEGQTVRYAWRMRLPPDFPSDAPSNRWWLVAQWHDQPNRNRGETWDNYPGHSPSVGLGYGQINGVDQLSLLYGAPDPAPAGLIPIRRGVWLRLAVEVTWSRGAAGRVRVLLDDAVVREARGRNMYNEFQHYMKLGMYRHPEIRGDAWLAISGVEIRRL